MPVTGTSFAEAAFQGSSENSRHSARRRAAWRPGKCGKAGRKFNIGLPKGLKISVHKVCAYSSSTGLRKAKDLCIGLSREGRCRGWRAYLGTSHVEWPQTD